MYKYDAIISAIDEPTGEQHLVKKYQRTGDIIKDLIACFKEYNYQAKPVVKLYSTGNFKKDAENIYNFIKNNIEYKAESEQEQTTRSFNRIIHDKWGDCKHTALIVSSLAYNMGYDVLFKFVNYEDKTNHFGHVYAIIEDSKTKQRAIIDTLQDFNYQKPYKHAINYKVINQKNQNMALSRLTGVDDEINGTDELQGVGETYSLGGIGAVQFITAKDLQGIGAKRKAAIAPLMKKSVQAARNPIKTATTVIKRTSTAVAPKATAKATAVQSKGKAKRAEKKETRKAKQAPKKAARKEKRSAVKAKIKARGGIVKTVALAPVRAAGTLLIRENFRGFATRLKILKEREPNKFADFTKKFGWKLDFLTRMVEIGARKKALFGSKTNGISGVDDVMVIEGIGAVSIAAAVTTAAPVIIAITKLLSDAGLQEPTDTTAAREAGQNIVNETPDVAEVQELTAAEEEAAPQQEEEEEAIEEAEEAEEGEEEDTGSLGAIKKKRKKFATALKKVELATKAASKGVATYKKSTATSTAPKKTMEVAVIPDKAQTFFERAKESFKEKPLVWIGGGGLLILAGNKIFSK